MRFISEVEFYDVDFQEIPDTNKVLRLGIKFFFKRIGAILPIQSSLFDSNILVAEPEVDYEINLPNQTERKGLVTSRIGHGAYRKRIIHRWEYECAVTGFDKLSILIASHIFPWAESTDNQRLDVHNEILLSPNYDALFDRHLITFENTGKIILSDSIEIQAFSKFGITGKEKIKKFSQHNFEYLDKHRSKFNSQIGSE